MNKSKFLIATLGVGLVLGLAVLVGLPAITDTMAKKYQADKIDQVFDKLGDSEKPVAERVDLPDIEGYFWCTLFVPENFQSDPTSARLVSWFQTDPRLVAMKDRCRVQTFKSSDTLHVQKYRGYVGDTFPVVLLQHPQGKVCYKASGANLPPTADQLVADMSASVEFCRPKPEPTPPAPTPAPAEPVNPLPDTTPDQPAKTDEPVWLLVVLGAVGVILGVAVASKNQ